MPPDWPPPSAASPDWRRRTPSPSSAPPEPARPTTTTTRLTAALQDLVSGLTGTQLGEILDIPKRTAERWLVELREGNLGNWHGQVIERLADHEWHAWGTTRIFDALRPLSLVEDALGTADAARVSQAMRTLINSHQANSTLILEMASALADSVIHDHEARGLLPLVQTALAATTDKRRDLAKLELELRNRLKG